MSVVKNLVTKVLSFFGAKNLNFCSVFLFLTVKSDFQWLWVATRLSEWFEVGDKYEKLFEVTKSQNDYLSRP